MQVGVGKWRGVSVMRDSMGFLRTQLAQFHSTPACNDKWRKKPSSSQIKFSTRQKRADAKKALNNLLFHFSASTGPFQPPKRARRKERIVSYETDFEDNYESKSSSRRTQKDQRNRMKRKLRRAKFDDEDDCFETLHRAKFGFPWIFNSPFESSTTGFYWKWESAHKDSWSRQWQANSESESDDEAAYVGGDSDRRILGLPIKGPLKMEDVKTAFRLSALKWHPDKHQGPSQAAAEEKFKECVNAYKSLCDILATT